MKLFASFLLLLILSLYWVSHKETFFPFLSVPMLDQLCSALLHHDDALKSSVLTVWLRLHEAAQGAAAQALPTAVRDRLCVLLLQNLSNTSSPPLINNCVGEEKPLTFSLSSCQRVRGADLFSWWKYKPANSWQGGRFRQSKIAICRLHHWMSWQAKSKVLQKSHLITHLHFGTALSLVSDAVAAIIIQAVSNNLKAKSLHVEFTYTFWNENFRVKMHLTKKVSKKPFN